MLPGNYGCLSRRSASPNVPWSFWSFGRLLQLWPFMSYNLLFLWGYTLFFNGVISVLITGITWDITVRRGPCWFTTPIFFGLMVDISIQDEGLQNDFPWTGEAPPLQSLATTICEPWCWNIYQHLPEQNSPSYVGKYTSTMEHMGLENTTIPESSGISSGILSDISSDILFGILSGGISSAVSPRRESNQIVPWFLPGLSSAGSPVQTWLAGESPIKKMMFPLKKKNMHF